MDEPIAASRDVAIAVLDRLSRAPGVPLRWLAAPIACFLITAVALGQEHAHPLKAPDWSSPRATLRAFLDSGDALGAFLARDYIASPSRAQFHRLAMCARFP